METQGNLNQPMALLAERCKELGMPVTVQRRAIFEAILRRADHPTADQIYEDVKQRMLGISKATVYRTLETLVSLGLVLKACHAGNAIRFDPNIQRHHHLICMRCGAVQDVHVAAFDELPLPDTRPRNFKILDYTVQLMGLCQECQPCDKEQES
jgi:Fur family peroxide stress response transcriptional regulator